MSKRSESAKARWAKPGEREKHRTKLAASWTPEKRAEASAAWTPEKRAAAREATINRAGFKPAKPAQRKGPQPWTDARRQQARARSLVVWTPERREAARIAAYERSAAGAEPTRADAVIDGASFGRLTVLVQRLKPPHRELGGKPLALCRCSCGDLAIVPVAQLVRKDRPTRSCGCKGVSAARRLVAKYEARATGLERIRGAKVEVAEGVAALLGVA